MKMKSAPWKHVIKKIWKAEIGTFCKHPVQVEKSYQKFGSNPAFAP